MGDLLKESDYTASTNGYVSLLKAKFPAEAHGKLLIHIIEAGGQDILYKVLGSTDDVTYFTESAEATLTANTSAPVIVTNPWVDIDVQIMSAAPGTPGSVKAVMVVG